METINGLLKALNNKVPASFAKRLDGLSVLNEKLELAKTEDKENPTEDSQEKINEIINFIDDTKEDLIEDLSELLSQKREIEAKNNQIAKNRAEAEAKAKILRQKDLEAKKIEELQQKALEAKKIEELQQKEIKDKEELEKQNTEKIANNDTENESGIGWGSLIVGGALLILSAGAINYFGNKR